MNERAIGVFDSGLGGLTAVRELKKLLPEEKIIYFGDTARVPYGTRSRDTITKFALQDMRFVLSHDVKAMLVACGTISSVALPVMKEKCPVYIDGVVNATAKAAAQTTKNGKILVLGTGATIKSGSYEKAIHEINSDIAVVSKACPMFVPIVENGYFDADNKVANLIAEDYLSCVRDFGADTVILGCTHYPLLADVISEHIDSAALIDSGKEAAKSIFSYLEKENLLRHGKGESKFYVSDEVENFGTLAEKFLREKISDNVEKVNIEEF